ncbi:MAG: hypothetical protein LBI30_02120 [Holosporales bacterium]|jgi:hypothetical protein|nr:hypothetical protein [Holosporales bacterium]
MNKKNLICSTIVLAVFAFDNQMALGARRPVAPKDEASLLARETRLLTEDASLLARTFQAIRSRLELEEEKLARARTHKTTASLSYYEGIEQESEEMSRRCSSALEGLTQFCRDVPESRGDKLLAPDLIDFFVEVRAVPLKDGDRERHLLQLEKEGKKQTERAGCARVEKFILQQNAAALFVRTLTFPARNVFKEYGIDNPSPFAMAAAVFTGRFPDGYANISCGCERDFLVEALYLLKGADLRREYRDTFLQLMLGKHFIASENLTGAFKEFSRFIPGVDIDFQGLIDTVFKRTMALCLDDEYITCFTRAVSKLTWTVPLFDIEVTKGAWSAKDLLAISQELENGKSVHAGKFREYLLNIALGTPAICDQDLIEGVASLKKSDVSRTRDIFYHTSVDAARSVISHMEGAGAANDLNDMGIVLKIIGGTLPRISSSIFLREMPEFSLEQGREYRQRKRMGFTSRLWRVVNFLSLANEEASNPLPLEEFEEESIPQ